ncbi:DUF3014 domain-containing protein [Gallaecimonas sp. GXIMD4217]|uniref:DUF3014 domain-containing protein n=1 Tax=Gallaecimonas sp. GXIMD4217 TaxID=3131927 RepID=UPI00311AE951
MQAEPRKTQQDKQTSPLVPVVVALVLAAGAGAYWFWSQQGEPEPAPQPVVEPLPVAPEPVMEAEDVQAEVEPEQEPVEPVQAQQEAPEPEVVPEPEPEPLPPLGQSDELVRAELRSLLPEGAPLRLQEAELVRKMAQYSVTLADGYLPPRQKLIAPPASSFEILRLDDGIYMDPESYRRFTPYVDALVAVDDRLLGAFLARFGPLFSAAYQELGLPADAFTANLDKTMALLLATPEPLEPIRLSQPRVLYQYADPELEALKPIQKLLLRMGPDNRGRLKDKLRAVQALLSEQG